MDATLAQTTDLGQLTRRLELDSLRLLAVVCTEGSYAKAAQVEPLTASAISKRIVELERAIGCTLLERSNYGVRPTLAGELVLAQWADVAASLAPLLSAADRMSAPERVQLSVVADCDAARFLMFDCLGHVDAVEDAAKVAVMRAHVNWLPVEFNKLSTHAAIWSLAPMANDDRGVRLAEANFDKFPGHPVYRFSAEVCVAVVRIDHPLAPLGLISGEDLDEYELVCSGGMLPFVTSRARLRQSRTAVAGQAPRISRPSWSHQMASTMEYLETVPCGTVSLLPTSARYLVHRFPGLRCLTLTEDDGCMEFACAIRHDAWLHERERLIERLTGCNLVRLGEETAATCANWLDSGTADVLALPAGLAHPAQQPVYGDRAQVQTLNASVPEFATPFADSASIEVAAS